MVFNITFHKYKKIYRLGTEETKELVTSANDILYVEEKIDGANARFMVKDKRIIFGSRTQSIGDSTKDIDGNWKRWTEYIKEILKDKTIPEGYIFYGEAMLKHTVSYDFEKHPAFIGFDIFNLKTDKFLQYPRKKHMFKLLGIELVHLIERTKPKKFIEEDIGQSNYYPGKCEGYCIKNYKTQTFGKIVRSEFQEMNKKTFGMSKSGARKLGDDSEIFIATYCPNARVDKHIFKLLDDGQKLEMKLMKYLPKQVWEDIINEEAKTILRSNLTLNLKNVRIKVAKRCKAILEQMIENSYLNA